MEHKGRHRVILIGPRAQAILLPYLLRNENIVCFEGPKGGEQCPKYYGKHIRYACDKAFPAPAEMTCDERKKWQKDHRWAPNRLRHTRATEVRKTHGLEAAQAVLGHATADVTQIYAERDIEKAAEVMARVG